jgi:hypothetical protein
VAPLLAGLTALINQHRGTPVGFLNPLLYGSLAEAGAFRDITDGNNGVYQAGPGWDPCTGLGSPKGTALLSILAAHADGGAPAGAEPIRAPDLVQLLDHLTALESEIAAVRTLLTSDGPDTVASPAQQPGRGSRKKPN